MNLRTGCRWMGMRWDRLVEDGPGPCRGVLLKDRGAGVLASGPPIPIIDTKARETRLGPSAWPCRLETRLRPPRGRQPCRAEAARLSSRPDAAPGRPGPVQQLRGGVGRGGKRKERAFLGLAGCIASRRATRGRGWPAPIKTQASRNERPASRPSGSSLPTGRMSFQCASPPTRTQAGVGAPWVAGGAVRCGRPWGTPGDAHGRRRAQPHTRRVRPQRAHPSSHAGLTKASTRTRAGPGNLPRRPATVRTCWPRPGPVSSPSGSSDESSRPLAPSARLAPRPSRRNRVER